MHVACLGAGLKTTAASWRRVLLHRSREPHEPSALPVPSKHNWSPSPKDLTDLWLPGEVWWDWCGDKGLHGLPVDLLEHEQDLWTLGNQLALAAGVKLFDANKKTHSRQQMSMKHF